MKYLIAVLVAGFLMIKLLLKEQIPENWMNSAAQIPGFLENKTLLAANSGELDEFQIGRAHV